MAQRGEGRGVWLESTARELWGWRESALVACPAGEDQTSTPPLALGGQARPPGTSPAGPSQKVGLHRIPVHPESKALGTGAARVPPLPGPVPAGQLRARVPGNTLTDDKSLTQRFHRTELGSNLGEASGITHRPWPRGRQPKHRSSCFIFNLQKRPPIIIINYPGAGE